MFVGAVFAVRWNWFPTALCIVPLSGTTQSEIVAGEKNANHGIYVADGDEKQTFEGKLTKGDRYMLLDLGGGTADITCHEVMGRGSVKEIAPPSGI